jgi:hypothetical protein
MSCNCIEDFNKLIREQTEDPEAVVQTTFTVNRKTGKMGSMPSMYCRYREKKKDGSWMKPKDHPISGEYCPFCGKPYNEEVKS